MGIRMNLRSGVCTGGGRAVEEEACDAWLER